MLIDFISIQKASGFEFGHNGICQFPNPTTK